MVYVDPEYAPLGCMQKYIDQMRDDSGVEKMMQNQMISDLLGQLEVAVKLHTTN
jgi:hypothetical protein